MSTGNQVLSQLDYNLGFTAGSEKTFFVWWQKFENHKRSFNGWEID